MKLGSPIYLTIILSLLSALIVGALGYGRFPGPDIVLKGDTRKYLAAGVPMILK